mgnify:CR=1 FL=1
MIDTLKEKIELYMVVKKRIELLRSLEKQSGLPMPETRENIALALAILKEIYREKSKEEVLTSDEIRERVFGKWEAEE